MQNFKFKLFPLVLPFLWAADSHAVECGINMSFTGIPKITKNEHTLSADISVYSKQYLNYKSADGARIATNATCQKLSGAGYTGTDEEWQQHIVQTVNMLAKKGFSEVKFTRLIAGDKKFDKDVLNQEYTLRAISLNGKSQMFYVLNFLNDNLDTLYTIMVSGDTSVSSQIEYEFDRAVKSIKL